MARFIESPYPNSKIVMAVFWAAMGFGAFWVVLIFSALALFLVFLLPFGGYSSGTGPVTDAEKRFCYALTLGIGEERAAIAHYSRAFALAADDERVPQTPERGAGAGASGSTYGEGRLAAAALNNRGVKYVALGELDDALADFSETLRIDPSMGMAYENRALVHMRNGDYAAAADDFDSAIANSRDRGLSYNKSAYLGRAVAHTLAGDDGKAAADFRLARRAGHHLADDPERAAEYALKLPGWITYGGAKGNLCPDGY